MALEALVASEDPADIALVDALCNRVHHTMVWKYRNRRRRPGLQHAEAIEVITSGRIPMKAWLTEIAQPNAKRTRSKAKPAPAAA